MHRRTLAPLVAALTRLSLCLTLSLLPIHAAAGGDAAAGAITAGSPVARSEIGFGFIPLPGLGHSNDDAFDAVIHDDLNGLIKRRQIRALVAWSRTDYFLDQGRQRGASYESIVAFERWLNRRYKRLLRPIHVVIIPVARDELITMLEQGRGDIAVASLTITPERRKRIDFSEPIYTGTNEVVVSERLSPLVPDRFALSGQKLFMRASSSYAGSITALNGELIAAGMPPAEIRYADEHLEDEDILELVNTGAVQRTVVDDYKARLWAAVLPGIRIDQAIVRQNASLAWGVRKHTPKLKSLVDEFVRGHRIGTEFGNVLARRYYGSTNHINQPLSAAELKRYDQVIGLFRKYGEMYGFDPLLLTAQAFQESGLEQSARSSEGAIGIMQVLPRTGRAMKVGDIQKTEPNIHAGVKYLRHIADTYLEDPGIDNYNRTLLAFAGYNAGPGNLAKARRLARHRRLDPNTWFHNVEHTMGDVVGVQPVQYVANISKYYLAYKLVEEQRLRREEARDRINIGGQPESGE